MIEVGVGDQHEVDRGKVVVGESRMSQAAHDQEPIGPIWIDQDIGLRGLNQKRSMSDPGDANLAFFELREKRRCALAMSTFSGEECR